MAVTSPATVRAALIDQLQAATGILTLSWQDNPPGPCLMVRRSGGRPRTDYGRTSPAYTFTITALVQRHDLDAAQEWLDAVAARGSDESVWDALEADRTIGDTCQSILLGEVTADAYVEFGEVPYLGCEFTVETFPTST